MSRPLWIAAKNSRSATSDTSTNLSGTWKYNRTLKHTYAHTHTCLHSYKCREISRTQTHSDLVVIALVVVHVQNAKELRVSTQTQSPLSGCDRTLTSCLTRKAFHLNVEELPEVTKPLNELRGDAAVKLWKRMTKIQGSIMNHIKML